MNEKLQKIKLVITDVDGVLTDGLLHYDANGEAIKSFHVRDGLGIRMLMEHGIQVAVLSGRSSPILQKRMQDLGIKLAIRLLGTDETSKRYPRTNRLYR